MLEEIDKAIVKVRKKKTLVITQIMNCSHDKKDLVELGDDREQLNRVIAKLVTTKGIILINRLHL